MRILAIDDEQDILRLIERALKGQYQVDTVLSPVEREIGDLSVYDLIIMDVMMPGESGYDLLKKIRNKVGCPIIFLSAKALEEDVIYGLSLGADDYIRKPFSVAELRARISAHIRRDNRETVKNLIQAGDISLCPEACELRVQGEWLVLAGFIGAYILAILIPSVILIHGLRKMIYEIAQEKWRKEYETKQEMAQIAHDLKTPLTVIRGNADLLLEKDQDEDSLESINAIISSSERIARSVLDILEK